MAKNVLVVVDPDVAIPRRIAGALRGDVFDVVPCATARGALNACVALEPTCLVSEIDLEGADDGLWLTATLRRQRTRLRCTPILLLSRRHDEATRVHALGIGADCFVTKPFRDAELAAQIGSLVGFAARVRARKQLSPVPRASLPPGATTTAADGTIRGDLSKLGVPAVLTALELEARSGQLLLNHPRRDPLVLELASGALVAGRRGHITLEPLDAMIAALRWHGRWFSFQPGPARTAPDGALPIGTLVLYAVARGDDDEEAQAPREASPGDDELGALDSVRPRVRSGTRRKAVITATEDWAMETPARALIESMAPSARPDPRREEDDEDTTDHVRSA